MSPVLPMPRLEDSTQCRRRSHSMWVLADVIGLFSNNVGSFSRNVGQSVPMFSVNVVQKRRM
jgi:hypothetical protein